MADSVRADRLVGKMEGWLTPNCKNTHVWQRAASTNEINGVRPDKIIALVLFWGRRMNSKLFFVTVVNVSDFSKFFVLCETLEKLGKG